MSDGEQVEQQASSQALAGRERSLPAPKPRPEKPVIMPEAFDGVTREWPEYLAYFKSCAELNQWEDQQKAMFLGVRLRGTPSRFFFTMETGRQSNWQHLCEDMGKRFAPASEAAKYKSQFRALRRGPGEAIPLVTDELRKLVTRAYPTATEDLREELVRDQFIEAMTPARLRTRLLELAPVTVQAAEQQALHLERVWDSHDMGIPRHARILEEDNPPMLVAAATREEPWSRMSRTLDQLAERLDRMENRGNRARGPFMGSCFTCGEKGHKAYECSNRTRGGAPNRHQAGNGQ